MAGRGTNGATGSDETFIGCRSACLDHRPGDRKNCVHRHAAGGTNGQKRREQTEARARNSLARPRTQRLEAMLVAGFEPDSTQRIKSKTGESKLLRRRPEGIASAIVPFVPRGRQRTAKTLPRFSRRKGPRLAAPDRLCLTSLLPKLVSMSCYSSCVLETKE